MSRADHSLSAVRNSSCTPRGRRRAASNSCAERHGKAGSTGGERQQGLQPPAGCRGMARGEQHQQHRMRSLPAGCPSARPAHPAQPWPATAAAAAADNTHLCHIPLPAAASQAAGAHAQAALRHAGSQRRSRTTSSTEKQTGQLECSPTTPPTSTSTIPGKPGLE